MLRVVRGPSAGKEFKIPVDSFVIGRGDGCHLKPKSDMISRRHCELRVADSKLVIEDFGSKNGTFVNNEPISGTVELKMGDELRVGPLEFLVLIDHSLGAAKRPRVNSVKEAATRVAEAGLNDSDVASWLAEADEEDRMDRLHNPEGRQFRIGETVSVEDFAEDEEKPTTEDETTNGTKSGFMGLFGGRKKKEYGKLPQMAKEEAQNSRDAAQETLKKMFDRR
ncbi:FHA domain-containing protein [Blastopirellula sp. JC732]|uniref:FHA domain-containing protein n=2 Tax=Blastopirellula sediminis TaxID=2894196 RepID=A0A9X1MQ79_9BACT|nr:FHA domain-containing protein [Blastopirellula sediminis]MCC9605794.1 FHA domain-containing protein [Blastopirellula sediminis]MCC9630906.1 FHA domain-containing protein [Blastopirellula sediminis]